MAETEELTPPTVQDLVGEALDELNAGAPAEVVTDPSTDQTVTEDPPETYFGVPMGDLPPETRQQIQDAFKAKDSRITKLEQRVAEQRKAEDENPEPLEDLEPAVMPSDEELLGLFGFTSDHPYYEMAREITLPVVKQNLILAGTVEQLRQESQAEQAWNFWNDELDTLERQHGTLPIDRDTVFEFAAEQNILDPEVAYMKLAFAAKETLNEETTKARVAEIEKLRDRKRQGGVGVRPRGSVPVDVKAADLPKDNLNEAIKAAAAQTAEEMGLPWDAAAATFLNGR
jgi:hypothetical protein